MSRDTHLFMVEGLNPFQVFTLLSICNRLNGHNLPPVHGTKTVVGVE